MNKIFLHGRLTAEPETKMTETANGKQTICKFSLAVNRAVKTQDGATADFFNCVAFGKRGELIAEHFHKGSEILVSGTVRNDKYKDKEGKTRTWTSVIIDDFNFCGSKETAAAEEETPDLLFM